MKTSNKILLGFGLFIFFVPFIFAWSLKSKINKGDYTIVNLGYSQTENKTSGTFNGFKVIKIAAPEPHALRCYLKLSDGMNYSYNTQSLDSLSIFVRNDTLYIQHPAAAGRQTKSEAQHYEIDVFAPAFDDLVVDGASVIIDSVPNASGSFRATLKNGGFIGNE